MGLTMYKHKHNWKYYEPGRCAICSNCGDRESLFNLFAYWKDEISMGLSDHQLENMETTLERFKKHRLSRYEQLEISLMEKMIELEHNAR